MAELLRRTLLALVALVGSAALANPPPPTGGSRHDLIMERAFGFVRAHTLGPDGQRPFFLLLAPTIPHANNEAARATGNGQEVPDHGRYAERPWSESTKGQAAMISRLDDGMGRLFELLVERGIDEQTIVFFTSDNGPHDEGGHDTGVFDPNGPLRGLKRDRYEGGIRVPLLVRWPGHTEAGSISDHVAYLGDFFNTACALAGVEESPELDSISFVAALEGRERQQERHEQVKALLALMEREHTPNENWKPSGSPPPTRSPPGVGELPF